MTVIDSAESQGERRSFRSSVRRISSIAVRGLEKKRHGVAYAAALW
jgi:hypothetical protein